MFHKTNPWIALFLCAVILISSPAIISLAESKTIDSAPSVDSEYTESKDIASDISAESESTESKSTESESTELESTESENTESESTESESTEPESTESESTESESTESESTEPEFTESESTESETLESETLESETTESDYEQSVTDAIAAFQALLREKPLMALLYHTDRYQVQQEAGSYENPAATIESGHTLYIQNIEILDEEVWYQVRFWLNGAEQTGYIEAYYLAYADEDWIAWEQEYLSALFPESTTYGITAYTDATGRADYSDISAFPGIYQENLRALKEQHPAWTFVPMRTGLDFDTAVSNETGTKNLIQNTSSNAAKGWVGNPCPTESGWYYATKPAVAYYMNPVNFLTETSIFQFEQLTFNSTYHTVSAIQSFRNNTFMKGKIPSDTAGRTYAQAV